MKEFAEMFEDHKKASQDKRAKNREKSADLLRWHGVQFERKNMGAHLVVSHDDKVADFWPGTGKWKIRGTVEYSRGVFKLLKALGLSAV